MSARDMCLVFFLDGVPAYGRFQRVGGFPDFSFSKELSR